MARGRPPSDKTLVDRQLGRNIKHPILPAGDSYIVPNHSGDHSAGTTGTPVSDLEIANKKYVDDNASLWEVDGAETQLKTADSLDIQSQDIVNVNLIEVDGSPSGTPITNVLYSDNVCKAWINFNGVPLNGTYSLVSNVVTVTMTAHALAIGMGVNMDFTTGTASDGFYTVTTVADANTFTFALVSSDTSGNVTRNLYVRDSFNVSSVADLGVGHYAISWDTDFADTNYCLVGSITAETATGIYFNTYSVGSIDFVCATVGVNNFDTSVINVQAFGTQ